MSSSEEQINKFILERVPYFAYEKYHTAYFTGKSETPPSVWINVVIEDWKYFRQTVLAYKDLSPLAQKMETLCTMLEGFLLEFNQANELNRPISFQRNDWKQIVQFAQNFYK